MGTRHENGTQNILGTMGTSLNLFTCTRSISTFITQIKQGWNGHQWHDEEMGHQVHNGVTGETCQKYISHCMKELEAWIHRSGDPGSEYHPEDFIDIYRNIVTTPGKISSVSVRSVERISARPYIQFAYRGSIKG